MRNLRHSAPKALAATLGLMLLPGMAQAVPFFYAVNGHYYELFTPGAISWEDASAAATGLGGYLATLTSPGEDAFVWSNVPDLHDDFGKMAWLGGFQPPGSPETGTGDATEGWTWVTGEPWTYTNWNAPTSEPNNFGEEDYLHLGRFTTGTWNDANNASGTIGYIVEWDSNPVPEPGTLILLGSGLAGVALRRRSKKASSKTD